MIWLFSDGTVFELGGRLRGSSKFADALRRDVERVQRGQPPPVVTLGPSIEELALDRPDLVDLWLRDEARRLGVDLASAPAFERARAPADEGLEDDEGVEY